MRLKHWLLVLVVAVGMNSTLQAGIFSRKPKPDAAERVPALIMQLKTDQDEGKRQNAAEELRSFDPKSFPEMITVLVDALTKDASVGVRVEAASTIAKLRPIDQQAGFALEQAAANDPSIRVRMAARQSLWQYHLVGYRSGKPTEKGPAMMGPAMTRTPSTHTSAKNPNGVHESPEPPLADPVPSTSQKPLQPVAPPKLLTPPPSNTPAPKPTQSEGPALTPPG